MGFIFKPIRWILGQIIIFIDWVTRPKIIERSEKAQEIIDQRTRTMALYQFQQCPFCVKTRRQIRRLGLKIETRDARNDPKWNEELVCEGGKYQVPCLKISNDDGSTEWLYESTYINQYLDKTFFTAQSH